MELGAMSDYLPCPFCGCACPYPVHKHVGTRYTALKCGGCAVTTACYESVEAVTAVWNRRSPLALGYEADDLSLAAAEYARRWHERIT